MKKQLLFFLLLGTSMIFPQDTSSTDSLEIANKISDWNTAWSTNDITLTCKQKQRNTKTRSVFQINTIKG